MFDVAVTRIAHHVNSVVTAAAVSQDDRHLVFALRDQNTLVFYNTFNAAHTMSYSMQTQAHTAPVIAIEFWCNVETQDLYVFSVALDFTILIHHFRGGPGREQAREQAMYERCEHKFRIPVSLAGAGEGVPQQGRVPTASLVGLTEPLADTQGRSSRGAAGFGSGAGAEAVTEYAEVPLTRYLSDLFYGDTLVSCDASQWSNIFLGTLSGHIIHLYINFYIMKFTIRVLQSLQSPATALRVFPMVSVPPFYYLVGTAAGSALLRRLNPINIPDITPLPQPQADASFDRVNDVCAFRLEMAEKQAPAVPEEIATAEQLFGSPLLNGDIYFVISCTQGGVLNVYITEDVQILAAPLQDQKLTEFCRAVQDNRLFAPFIRANLGVGPLRFVRVCPHGNLVVLTADGAALFVSNMKFTRDGKQFYNEYKNLLFHYFWQAVARAPSEAVQRQLEAFQGRILTDPTKVVDKVFSGGPDAGCVAASFQTANERGPGTCGCMLHLVTCSQLGD